MKRLLLLTVLGFTTLLLSAQKAMEIPLWADKEPSEAILYVYQPQNPNGTAIIMCPGGAYQGLAIQHEGHNMASWLNTMGITYMVLKYRMPNGNHTIPLADAERAMEIARNNAQEWKINPDKIGIMGCSAGGHLASTLSTHYSSKKTRPDFQILFYPVITMDEKYTHALSREKLLGSSPSQALVEKFSNEKQVTPETPKALIILSSDDTAVLPINGVSYYMALLDKGVSATLLAYPTGGHGWGFNDSFPYKRQWTEELEKWIREEIY